MNNAHKLAVFGKDVYMLYVVEMAKNSRVLIFF